MVHLNFFNFIALFFGIFYSGSCRKDRNDNFFFLSFSTCPDLFWLEMKPELCIFVFTIFLLFFFGIFNSWSSRKDRNDNFLFLSFASCPDPFWLEMKPKWWFLIF